MNIITQIELAMVDRLSQGLGQMAKFVGSYGGELDRLNQASRSNYSIELGDLLPEGVRDFPAVWVNFAGITACEPHGTSRQMVRDTGKFVVMVADKNVGSETARRHGGNTKEQVGTYPLIYGVRRLLMAQDFGLPIDPFRPGVVRSLYNSRLGEQSLSVFACEFQCAWVSESLAPGRWPCPQSAEDADAIFAVHKGRLEGVAPEWLSTKLDYHLTPVREQADAQDLIQQREKGK